MTNWMFNRTGIKITLLISISFTILLLILNFIVINRSRDTFVAVVHDRVVYTPFGPQTVNVVEPVSTETIENQFADQFQNSLLVVYGLGILASVIIGMLVSRLITQPLRKIELGIKKLEESDYQFEIQHTGGTEFQHLIDEFNHLAQELAKMEALRKDLISDTSHELKTPLTTLMAQLQGIKDGVLEIAPERVDMLLDQVYRLNDLVERLQEYSRLRSKTGKLKLVKFDLKADLDKVTESYTARLNKAKVKLQFQIPHKLTITADKPLFERIIINLLENSLKYAKGSVITISATETQITFADNGVGIGDEHLPYIFERFYRVEKSRNRDTGGLGLGLAIVKEIVEAHGWKISAETPEDGKGVEFRITLQA